MLTNMVRMQKRGNKILTEKDYLTSDYSFYKNNLIDYRVDRLTANGGYLIKN
jgi:hypothetical protein